ncbi:MAG: cytochrome c biogenesis protein CcsA, partial [Chloroflexota bacterium]|nr:cytochrome c biogenesis protein CcsA [Chloroflexota bacterium]
MNLHLSDLGHISLIIAFIVAVYSVVAPLLGARLRSLNLVTSARNGMFVIFALHTLAMAIILYAFLSKDFSFRIVELHASTDLPPLYALCALYADKTGSLFFWGWLISLFTAVMTLQKFNTYRQIMPYTIAILAGIQAFFLSMVALRANIFMQNPFPPADGYGLNPLLQNFGMLIHPPLLYIGFAGFMVVFAFVMGALISRSPSSEWIRGIRRWTLFAWCTLGLGNLIGAWWAYEELGWGGYWAWDPVENAGLMPWLLGTAFLHTMAMLRKRDYLQTWSFALIIFTFIFVLLSPFITHGGIASELHGFQGSPFVPYIFAFILLSLIASLAFLFIRRRELEASEKPATLISREGSFLLANIIFVIIVGIVVSLTVFPKLYELVSGGLIAIERSLFDWTGGIALLILVFFMGICPLLGWRRTSWSSIKRNFLYPFTIAFIIAIVILISGIGNWYAVAALV